ncbi:MAG: 1-deoxy-D-xylulose-5-phosphate reductoisomerase [Pseudomonadota bacterium]
MLGATGSIGVNTVDVITALGGQERFVIAGLTAQRNAARLAAQAIALGAERAVVADEAAYPELKAALAGSGVEAAAGEAAAAEVAGDAQWVMAAVVGAAGLPSVLRAAESGADLALANKEALVCAGDLLLDAMAAGGGSLLPVDSEHNAIFQCLERDQSHAVERLILTASGGPFREWSLERMRAATPDQALKHPNWSMGAKISIDSASMANKGLEVIEAARLFGMSGEAIEVVVHPQSVVHSAVGYADGSVLAQLGAPDMRTPIAYALGWPERVPAPVERLDLPTLARLDFHAPDLERFPALRLAKEALAAGGAAPLIFNAANEVAVEAYLARKIGFLDIAATIEAALEAAEIPPPAALSDVFIADQAARRVALERVDALS